MRAVAQDPGGSQGWLMRLPQRRRRGDPVGDRPM